MATKLWAVICGNIRDELDFKLTVSRLVDLRKQNKVQHILLSTWRDEIDKYSGLRDELKKLKVYVLENYPLSSELEKTPTESVNYWRQARQLLAALDVIPKTDFVLRLRTDRSLNYINQMDKLGVFENYQHPVPQLGRFPKLFDYKVTVFGPKMIRLLHMIDFVLLGNNRDLYKMINFDVSDLRFQKPCVANAQWYLYPFIQEFSIIRDYIRCIHFLHKVKILQQHVALHKENMFLPEIYYKVYSIYLMILYTHFNIVHMGKIKQMDYSDVHLYQFFDSTPNFGVQYTILGSSIRDHKILEYAISGKLKDSPHYKKFMHYVNYIIAYGNDGTHDLTHADYVELIELQRNNFYEDVQDRKWLKVLRFPPINPKLLHQYHENFDVQGLNIMNDQKKWEKLIQTDNVERDIYLTWLDIDQPHPTVTEKMLLPIARTGHQYAIYVLLDLLDKGYISEINQAEVKRIVFFYLDIHLRRTTENYQITRIIILLLKMQQQGKIQIEKLEKLIRCAFEKYIDIDSIADQISTDNPNLLQLLKEKLEILENVPEAEHYYVRNFIQQIASEPVDQETLNFFQSVSPNDVMILSQKWVAA